MNISDLFYGSPGRIFSSALTLVILALLFAMSYRLFVTRRRKAYFYICASIVIIMFQYAMILSMEFSHSLHRDLEEYLTQILKAVAFILINLGLYQLYRTLKRKGRLLIFGMIVLTLLLGARNIFLSAHLGKDILLDLYLLLVFVFCYFRIAPQIGESRKYIFSLAVAASIQLAHIVNTALLAEPAHIVQLMENYLPAVYYVTLFLIFLNRLVEVLQSTYESSVTDGLTGLYNRKYLVAILGRYIRREIPVSVLFSDIDNFKKLNDTQGHQAGDDMLRLVARIMKEESEDIGFAARFGGEEMVLVVADPGIDMKELAERVRSRVEFESIVTVSLGYSSYREGLTAEQLIKQADLAMYQAKQKGKNRAVRFTGAKAIPT